MISFLRMYLYNSGLTKALSKRRLLFIEKITGIDIISNKGLLFKNILEVGCGDGKDLIQFITNDKIKITGIDLEDRDIKQNNFNLIVGDAEKIEFPDNNFDLTFSFGVLEHINPILKLNKIISEINRVSQNYIIIVPSVSTLVEPHTGSLLWPIRSGKRKKGYNLNYFNDQTWLKFDGFSNANICRFFHFPFIITNLVIYKIDHYEFID